jgi:hypothetical protein
VTGVALVLVPAELVNTAVAVTVVDPRTEGFHVHVAVNGEDELVGLFLQPEMTIFRALKVTFAAALTFAVIVTGFRYEGFAPIVSELKTKLTGIFADNIPKLYLLFK